MTSQTPPPENVLFLAIAPFGIAPGVKRMMRQERAAAEQAIKTGTYVTWRSLKTGLDCARVGLKSRCFCGCSYEMHDFRRGICMPVCRRCECRGFDYVPSRPEEIGEWWLSRRGGFDASEWRAKCRCGHPHDAHHPVRRSCTSCKCGEFSSSYGCVACDCHQEDHRTYVESVQERKAAGRPVGQEFVPLSQKPHLSRLAFGRREASSSGRGKPSAVIYNEATKKSSKNHLRHLPNVSDSSTGDTLTSSAHVAAVNRQSLPIQSRKADPIREEEAERGSYPRDLAVYGSTSLTGVGETYSRKQQRQKAAAAGT
ncbi:unnamed protein product [Ascophyllum nodosum]